MFHHVITVIYVIDVTTFVKTFRNLHIRGLGGATPPYHHTTTNNQQQHFPCNG